MERTIINAPDAPDSLGRYAQAIGTTGVTRWIHVSGQVGATADGQIPETFEEQCRLAWQNVAAQLREGGMSITDIVKATVIMTDRINVDAYRAIRKEVLGDHVVAMTAIVADLLDPRWLVEIEVTAAR